MVETSVGGYSPSWGGGRHEGVERCWGKPEAADAQLG